MVKEYLNFDDLDPIDKDWFITETWCDYCDEADLGIMEIKLYRENGKEFIEGKCKKCKNTVLTEVVIQQIKGEEPKW